MADRNRSSDMFELLRKEAEELLAGSGAGAESAQFPEGIDSLTELIHELKVSHTELEIQNEELRETQVQLESAKDDYQRLYESAPVGYITLDADTRVTRVNISAVSLLRRRRPLLMGSRLDGFLTGQSLAAYRAALQRAAASHTRERADLYVVTSGDGEDPVWVQADIRAVVGEGGAVTGWLVTLIDMTDRKRAEEATRRAEEQALLNREVHHRVKNDIMLISSFLYLEEENAGDAATEEAFARARRRVDTIQHVYSSLQDQSGTRDRLNAGSLLEHALAAHNQALADMGGSLETSFSRVQVAPKVALSLGLIANELVTNAEKYAFDDTAEPLVRVVARPVKERGGSPGASDAADPAAGSDDSTGSDAASSGVDRPSSGADSTSGLRLIVSDNGRGFPASILNRQGGSFGLSVVEALAHQHGGSVDVSNKGPDGGARVAVTMNAV